MVANIPRVGMRMVKTALAVAICFFLYVLRGEEGVPIFSTIAAIICMQPYAENSIQVSINRIIGTLLGGSLCASGAVSDPIYSLSGAYPAISGDFLCGHSCDVCDGFIEAHGCFCAGRDCTAECLPL